MSVAERASWVRALGLVLAASASSGCRAERAVSPPRPETPAECAERQRTFGEFVARLPAGSVAEPTRVALPESTLGAVPGSGSVLEIRPDLAALDGDPIAGTTLDDRVRAFRERIANQWGPPELPVGGAHTGAARRVLYVAASADVDVRTLRTFFVHVPEAVELRLLVRSPPPKGRAPPGEGPVAARELAVRVLLERDPKKRKEMAEDGYGSVADCPALGEAVASVHGLEGKARWPALQVALSKALPSCECRKLDTASLRALISAEQRAGAASLAWVPLSFMRDERCDASMPLRSVKKLVRQMEEFDLEFAGAWQKDALTFGDVVESDRLGVYFCDALPGETLAAKERAKATLYLLVPGAGGCDAFRFEPLASGSPMGTWRRTASARPPLAFHYAQAAEEIRVFGPIDPASPSQPTDRRDWPCDETFRMLKVDVNSIELDSARWFYTEAACERATGETVRAAGCVAAHMAGTAGAPGPAANKEGS